MHFPHILLLQGLRRAVVALCHKTTALNIPFASYMQLLSAFLCLAGDQHDCMRIQRSAFA